MGRKQSCASSVLCTSSLFFSPYASRLTPHEFSWTFLNRPEASALQRDGAPICRWELSLVNTPMIGVDVLIFPRITSDFVRDFIAASFLVLIGFPIRGDVHYGLLALKGLFHGNHYINGRFANDRRGAGIGMRC